MASAAEDVLAWWFGPTAGGDGPADRSAFWFRRSEATDGEIRSRFALLREQAVSGALAGWELHPRSRLALIILVDQFSRNLFRDDPRAFAHDALARRWCLEGVELGLDRVLAPIERAFFYMPLQHSESRAEQGLGVALFERLAAEVPADNRGPFDGFADYARRHRDVVARFGRFPHRNAVLGRASTAEETAFLAQPGAPF